MSHIAYFRIILFILEVADEKETCIQTNTFIAICCVLGAFVLIQLIIIIVLCCRVKNRVSESNSYPMK